LERALLGYRRRVDSALPISVLDFVSIIEGQTAAEAIADTVAVAQAAEVAGYHRFWIPEHHNSSGLGFTSLEVLIAHLAAATSTIRVGAAGVMLPNHSPLKVAEVFKTLEALHPGRIDLGLGRAPGTDGVTAFALRGGKPEGQGDFPQLAAMLMAFLGDGSDFPDDHPYRQVIAAPVIDTNPEVFVLGSSGYGTTFASVNGMGAVFAHHMSPELAVPALRSYRADFRPGYLAKPWSAISVIAHATDDPDEALAATAAWTLLVDKLRVNERGPRPGYEAIAAYSTSAAFRQAQAGMPDRVFAGPADEVVERIRGLATAAEVDEVVIVSPLPGRQRRIDSLAALAKSWQSV
jgi:luciferase family oxidoreductase group 1